LEHFGGIDVDAAQADQLGDREQETFGIFCEASNLGSPG
jgi:hypothetical protein